MCPFIQAILKRVCFNFVCLFFQVLDKMNTLSITISLGVVFCFMDMLTHVYSTTLEDIEGDAAENFPPNIRYFLNNMKNDGLGLQAPPHVYMNKLKRYFNAEGKNKRNGFWIWMPAQGYVSVPNEQFAEGSKTNGGGNVLRYG